jgi:nitrate/TMAO reductase-like tetraheme cytochrome c subunit
MKSVTGVALLGSCLLLALFAGCGETTVTTSTSSDTLAASQACIDCHGTLVSPVTGAVIADEWKRSRHNTHTAGKKVPGYGAACGDCHEPASGHPNSCSQCHGGTPSGTSTRHDVTTNPDSALKCGKCHGPATLGAPHFNNVTSSGYPASYVTLNSIGKCRNCHNPHDPTSKMASNQQWAASGHGNTTANPWRYYDFKTRGSNAPAALTYGAICVRCHTATGYVNFVTSNFTNVSAWGVGSDKTKEVLSCIACHDDGAGNAYSFKVRKVLGNGVGITVYYNYSAVNTTGSVKINNAPTSYPDAATSNLCMLCHVGRETGGVIKSADRAGLNFSKVSRIAAHDFLAGANLFQKSGFEFYTSAAMYAHKFKHNQIGMNNLELTGYKGPCITCHMSAPGKHLFMPISSANNVVQAITATVCTNCHTPAGAAGFNLSATFIQGKIDGLTAALATIRALEIAKKIVTIDPVTQKITYTANWNTLYGSGTVVGSGGIHAGAYTMGASFNYNTLSADPGAFAHNSVYTRMLIYDSIDWLYNGAMDLDAEAAINWLLANAKISQTTHDAAIQYLQGTTTNPTGVGGTRPQ